MNKWKVEPLQQLPHLAVNIPSQVPPIWETSLQSGRQVVPLEHLFYTSLLIANRFGDLEIRL